MLFQCQQYMLANNSAKSGRATHTEQWAAIYAAVPGEQLGVRCLAQEHLSRGIEGGERALYIHSPPPTIPAGPETQTHNLLITSPTL